MNSWTTMKKIFFLLSFILWSVHPLSAQETKGTVRGEFEVPFYDSKNPNRLLSLIRGSQIRVLSQGQLQLGKVQVIVFDPTGTTNFIIQGTQCRYEVNRRVVWSPQQIHIFSGDRKAELKGVGFTYDQQNQNLIVSNQAMASIRRGKGETGILKITSDSLLIDLRQNLFDFQSHVVAEDQRFQLQSHRLRIWRNSRMSTNGSMRLLAEGEVVIQDRVYGLQAWAQIAEYTTQKSSRQIRLQKEVRWVQGRREGRAEEIELDLIRRKLQMQGKAFVRLPRSFQAVRLFPAGETNITSSKQWIQIAADQIIAFLPETNAPLQNFSAMGNVKVNFEPERIRLEAGELNLEKRKKLWIRKGVHWYGMGWEAMGKEMEVDLGEGSFVLTEKTQLVFDPDLLRGKRVANQNHNTNHWIFIYGRGARYQPPWLNVEGPVSIFKRETNGDYIIKSQNLQVHYENGIREIRFIGKVSVDIHNLRGKRILKADQAVLKFKKGGVLHSLQAIGHIEGIEYFVENGRRQEFRIKCKQLITFWDPKRDSIEKGEAKGDVEISYGDFYGVADRAQFDRGKGEFVFWGRPWIWTPEGRLYGAEPLRWNQKEKRISGEGAFRLIWHHPQGVEQIPKAFLEPNFK